MKQKDALNILKMGHNVFLTGAAGAGKTYILNAYVDYLRKQNIGVGITASTGIAATHIGGVTIHSWSGLGIKDSLSEIDLQNIIERPYLRKRFLKTKVLVIDEVSMLHSFQLDLVDTICRYATKKDEPFGGIQVILCGDLFQLPPVVKGGAEPKYITDAEVWDEMDMRVCYLDEQYRQNDPGLLQILGDIRNNTVDDSTIEPLRDRYKKGIEGVERPTRLYTHNIDVDIINEKELATIDGYMESYPMSLHGNIKLAEIIKKSCLAPETLNIKVGAVVMFVKNNYDDGYVNGTMGTVVGFDDGYPIVETKNGKKITALPNSWKIEEEGKTIAEIDQIPLRLAWAITIHKSQGMTLDAAEIDLSRSFVAGMGYVALSRLRSIEGLCLLGLNDVALSIDKKIIEINKELLEQSEEAEKEVELLGEKKIASLSDSFAEVRKKVGKKVKKESTNDKTLRGIQEKKSIGTIAHERGLTPGTIVGHIEKMQEKGVELDLKYMQPKSSHFKEILKSFKKNKSPLLSDVHKDLGNEYSFDEIRFSRLFVPRKYFKDKNS